MNNDVREGIKLFSGLNFWPYGVQISEIESFRVCLSWKLTSTSKGDLLSKTIITHSNTLSIAPFTLAL